MAEYYLISQLPSLDGISENTPLPITEERFLELCQRFLSKKAVGELLGLSVVPPREPVRSASALIEAWNEGERNLRLVLGRLRAEKMNKQFDAENTSLPVGLVQAARTAMELESPMEAEKFLSRFRLDFLETLRPMDSFSEDYVFYYWLKLKLLSRISKFDTKIGEEEYKNIYNSIMNKDRLEAAQ
ncbi:MAG: DUF2764 family protein [Oscillospiraceae bacterium]|nr:DUF2764 family protein [Oscillospiraceae bacterium]